MTREERELIGRRFGRLTVIRRVSASTNARSSRWQTECDCSNRCTKTLVSLKRPGTTPQCEDCLGEYLSKVQTTHGESGTQLYQIWAYRVRASKGVLGVGVRMGSDRIPMYEPWVDDYQAFASWVRENMGERPGDGYRLSRLDQTQGFLPGNLNWTAPGAHRKKREREPRKKMTPEQRAKGRPTSPTFVGPRKRMGRPPGPQI